MRSRVFRSLVSRSQKHRGGRGMKAHPTRVVRVPENHLEEVDILISLYREKIAASPDSPRHSSLKAFLCELEDMLPVSE